MRARLSDKSVQTELTDKSISHRDLDTTSLSPGITGHKQRAGKTVMWFFWLRADWVPRLLVVCMKDADLPANTCSMPAVKLEKLSRTPEMVMVCFQSKSLIAGTNRFQRLKPLLWKISISGFHHTLQCFTTTWWVVCCCLQTTSMRTSGDRSNLPATKATARRFWCSIVSVFATCFQLPSFTLRTTYKSVLEYMNFPSNQQVTGCQWSDLKPKWPGHEQFILQWLPAGVDPGI